mgnify:CR=1 FL=1
MAVTKILARNGGLKQAIEYVLNGDKTQEQVLTAHLNCDPGFEYQQMIDTKRELGKLNGRQCYHIIQSFVPGEITPELALQIATEFAAEYLAGYQVVIGTHTDRHHIHSHILFNSVNHETGEKYHCSKNEYYQQIRAVSDRLCREHGLSVIIQGDGQKSMSYIEWLRQSKGQPTYRSMLEADLKVSIEDANSIGDFFRLMERKGYEIKHGNRLGFKLRGQAHFMYPERNDKQYSEDGIRAAINGNLDAIFMGQQLTVVHRTPYKPYKKHPKYTGFLALYYHYLYILGKLEKRQYPPKVTGQMRREVMRFEQLRAQFQFLNENGIATEADMAAFVEKAEAQIKALTKQRTILNVQKKKRQLLFQALAEEEALAPAKRLYAQGHSGMEQEAQRYMEAVKLLDGCGVSREALSQQQSELYTKLADLNREIRKARKQIKMCDKIRAQAVTMRDNIREVEVPERQRQSRHIDRA